MLIKHVNAVKYRTLGIEYINLINIINFSYHEFILFKQQYLNEEETYQDSNFLFDTEITPQQPLQIEITTFNKNEITTKTKPKKIKWE